MNLRHPVLLGLIMLLLSGSVTAQQAETFGNYVVHYNAINSDQIPAQVAQAYGIRRSSSRALVTITVVDMSGGETGEAIPADVTVSAVNLTGQRREVDMREVIESDDAIYYVGEMPIHNLENYNFSVTAKVEDVARPFELSFRQQFYTE